VSPLIAMTLPLCLGDARVWWPNAGWSLWYWNGREEAIGRR
jgi:hypothetical protein